MNPVATLPVHDAAISNERRMWLSVLNQAIIDATTPGDRNANSREGARQWFRKRSRDFDAVCALAGIEPDCVIQGAQRFIADYDRRVANGEPPRKRKPSAPGKPRKALIYTLNGETLSLQEWAKRHGIDHRFVYNRLRRGWPLLTALTSPPSLRSRRANKRINIAKQSVVAPGEGQDLAPQLGTGGGCRAQESAKTEFPAPKEFEPCP